MNALVEPPEMGSGNYRIVVVLREDLEPWQRLNVTAFTVSGVAAAAGVVGQPYRDGSGLDYLPMFKEPALIFGANAEQLRRTADRARTRDVRFTLFTDPLFKTFNDHDNRVAEPLSSQRTSRLREWHFAAREKWLTRYSMV